MILNNINDQLQNKLNQYYNSIDELYINCNFKKPINAILLTGTTGYLGCNILNQLLIATNYKIFLLIRASSTREAFERIDSKFKFYFNKNK